MSASKPQTILITSDGTYCSPFYSSGSFGYLCRLNHCLTPSYCFPTSATVRFFLFCKLIVFLFKSDDGSEINCVPEEENITSFKKTYKCLFLIRVYFFNLKKTTNHRHCRSEFAFTETRTSPRPSAPFHVSIHVEN